MLLGAATLLVSSVGLVCFRAERTPVAPASDRGRVTGELPNEPYDPVLGLRTPGPVQEIALASVRPGETVAAALAAKRIASDVIVAVLGSLASVIDFRTVRPSDQLRLHLAADQELLALEILRGPLDHVRTDKENGAWRGYRIEKRVESIEAQISGSIATSLWVSLVEEGKETPALVSDLVEVFAWDVDFYSEVHAGDTYRILVEKRYSDGAFVGYGPIAAAELILSGSARRAFRFEGADGLAGYYDVEGGSMRKQLLKAPLKYGHVTSRFGGRRHPILGYTRQHNGIDYGVPTGTPVWSVGEGRVVTAGWSGGYGKLIEVRHANGWLSQYAHLSRINVKVGERVAQKQIIGATGTTGMSTGPHLHYGLKRNNHYVNPLAQKFEREQPLAGPELQTFKERVAQMTEALQRIPIASLEATAAVDVQ